MISCQLVVTNQFRGLDRTRVGQGMTGHESQTMLTAGGPTTSTGLKAKEARWRAAAAASSGTSLSLGSFAGFNVTASAHSKLSRAPSSESAIA